MLQVVEHLPSKCGAPSWNPCTTKNNNNNNNNNKRLEDLLYYVSGQHNSLIFFPDFSNSYLSCVLISVSPRFLKEPIISSSWEEFLWTSWLEWLNFRLWVELCPRKSWIDVLTPVNCECDLVLKGDLQVELRWMLGWQSGSSGRTPH
jgi:hypothetical protein